MTGEELLPFCACGKCGLRVTKKGNKFILGHHRRGVVVSKETCKKLSDAAKARPPPSDETRKKLSEGQKANPSCGMLGKHHTDETKQKIRNAIKDKPLSLNHRANISSGLKGHIVSDITKINISKGNKGKPKSPEHCEAMSTSAVKYWDDPHNRNVLSEIITNSEAAKVSAENMRGGNDICEHHYIYDHSDLSKYTMKMARSQHTSLHRNMQTLGLKVPHINTGHENEDELKLMEYIKKIESKEEQNEDNTQ